jgi:integrase
MTAPILRQNTRILTPREYRLLRENLNPKYICICDVMLNTGMRWEEFWDFLDHPHWFSAARRCIELPKGAVKKKKSVYTERTILLTVEGCEAVKTLFSVGGIAHTSRVSVGAALKRAALAAGIGSTGIAPKMFRKTLVSWLVACYPEKLFLISGSLGHELETMRRHYVNLAFERRDIEDMRVFLQGWGEV